MSYHRTAGNWTQVLCKSDKCSQLLSNHHACSLLFWCLLINVLFWLCKLLMDQSCSALLLANHCEGLFEGFFFWSQKSEVLGMKWYIHIFLPEKVDVSQASENLPQGLKSKPWSWKVARLLGVPRSSQNCWGLSSCRHGPRARPLTDYLS